MDIEKLKQMDFLIRTCSTGQPADFACRLGVSTRTLFNYLSYMKMQLGAPIEYCEHFISYRYTQQGVVCLGWQPRTRG